MTTPRLVSAADIELDPATYKKVRAERRREMLKIKEHRRIPVGPFVMFYFENFETMRYQVQEMVYTERGGEAQLEEELAAYNPLIPNGSELVATVMLEITDPVRRDRELSRLVGIEQTFSLSVDGEEIAGKADTPPEPERSAGARTASVHFVHFPFTAGQIEKFRTEGARVVLRVGHPNYDHMAALPEESRKALAADFS